MTALMSAKVAARTFRLAGVAVLKQLVFIKCDP
jgi:hypothetical protein